MPRLQYDDPELQSILDDEDNAYTPEQVRAATEALVRDESGQGSLGGLAEDDEGQSLTTAEQPEAAPVEKVDRSKRELNPLNFGDFFRSNIFGGVKARDYVTGKRPMTVFDYATDVLSAYGGEDLGKRNAGFIKAEADRAKAEREGRLAESRIKTNEATQRKAGLETEKLANEAIQRMMHDTDAEFWSGELKALQKQHGIQLRPGVVGMVEKMATKLAEAGATHPAEVLENPDKYDPNLVNRVRHTMTILNKDIEESQGRLMEQEKGKQALGLRKGEEQRKQQEFEQKSVGVDDAIDQVASSDLPPNERQGLIAALRAGGTPRDEALKRLAGIRGQPGRGAEYAGLLQQAEEELRRGGNANPTPGQINAKAQELKIGYAGQRKQKVDVTTQAQKGMKATTEAFNQLNTIKDAVSRVGLTKSALAAWTTQPLMTWIKRAGKSAALSALDSIDAVMGQIARSVSGEVGVLTNPDIERIRIAVKPDFGIVWETSEIYSARLAFVEEIMKRAQAAHKRALETGQYEPVDASDLTFPGDPFPSEAGQARGPKVDPEEKNAAADAVRALPQGSPERKAALADYVKKYGGK